ncbi:la-related protein 1C-like [Capsella rubella]|uniref:la-related protein 1C-like n=1 Tax=Capsella rubella TaxID=81985 RepID=UPI000CD50F26|nr:la-related protein 1C-like [Capsella rubella]
MNSVERRSTWNISSSDDFVIKPVLGDLSWPELSDTTKTHSSKTTSDSSRKMSDASGSSLDYDTLRQNVLATKLIHFTKELLSTPINVSVSAKSVLAQPSGQSSYVRPEQLSHGGTKNQHQWNSYDNQNGNQQRHGGWRSQSHGHGNQNLNLREGFIQAPRGIPGYVIHAPPPMPLVFDRYMLPTYQPCYHFGSPMVSHDLAPPRMYNHSPPRPLIKPPLPVVYQDSLETRIRNQVHYYFSEKNLKTDNFMRMRMSSEGFVHIQFIAGFNKLKALTRNIQLIVDALQNSNVVELKGYEIRSRDMWRKYLMPLHLRVPFVPTLEHERPKQSPKPITQNINSGKVLTDNLE